MTDYTELVKALRHCVSDEKGVTKCAGCPYYPDITGCMDRLHTDAAAAIEALQAEVQSYKALANECKASAENKERLLRLYRAEQAKHFYSAIDDNGRIKATPCACLNIPVFPDSSESPNS